ncbi:MAG: N-methylhydantoinase [Solirubrobacteraceae bacterium]|nr:N-methylhydantoinase [Solirubrobacteraceae bacterium]
MSTTKPTTVALDRHGLEVGHAEVLSFALHQVSAQMQEALVRSAFSAVVRDIVDCHSAINMLTDAGWETVATTGPSQHSVGTGHICNFVMEEYGIENLRPGDVLFHNDPWRGAIHQSDVSVTRPVFVSGELAFLLETSSHLVDMGGPIAGGYPTGARFTYEESLRIPPTLLFAEDIPNRSLFEMILESTRVPALNLGDLRALYGALVVGERLLCELCERESLANVRSAAHYALDTAEASMRAAISNVPDGDYMATDVLDDDGINARPLRVSATVRVRGDELEVDFSGTEAQAEGNSTTAWCESTRALIAVKMLLDPLAPYNGGAMRPCGTLLPVGSLVAGLPPTSVSDHGSIGVRVVNTVLEALTKALPEEDSVAPDSGNPMFLGLQGVDTRPGRNNAPFGSFVLPGGAWGGTARSDGLGFTTVPNAGAVCRSSVYEHVERESPVIFWEHGYMIDSAGPGKHRGGVGAYVTVESLSPVEISCVAERIRMGAPGHGGGGRGMPAYAWWVERTSAEGAPPSCWNGVAPASELRRLFGVFDEQGRPDPINGELGAGAAFDVSKFSGLILQPGEILRVVVGGGGGWGDPLQRDTSRVLDDVLDELVSVRAAREDYGVVLAVAEGRVIVDEDATSALRAELAANRDPARPAIACFSPWPVERSEMSQLEEPIAAQVASQAATERS